MSTKSSDGGKGSSPRPFSVSQDEYNKRWDAIFGRDLEADATESSPSAADLSTAEDEEDDEDDSLRCVRCGGVDTMYVAPNGLYRVCDQCGLAERILHDDPDY